MPSNEFFLCMINHYTFRNQVCCPVSSDVPLPPAPSSLDGEEYQYGEYEENEYYDQNSCSSGTECLPLSQCDLTHINSDESPPTYCKDSSKTGEDHFCRMKNTNISMLPNQVREQRLFTKFYNSN